MMDQQRSSIVTNQPFKTYRGIMTTAFGGKQPAAKTPQTVYCPDGYHTCPSGHTCCLNLSGVYVCCNLLDEYASCCSDGQHCCALGYSCNGDGTCRQTSIVCPGRKGTCPLSTTCCALKSGNYGCCPRLNGVCCSNDKCCPSGYYCTGSGCARLSLSGKQSSIESPSPIIDTLFMKYPINKKYIAAALMKQPSIIKAPQNIVCPDGRQCPSNNTCCENFGSSGGYACCPGINNCCDGVHDVCCPDGKHCCPEGYSCDPSGGPCLHAASSTPKSVASTAKSVARPQQPAIKLSGKVNVKQDDFL
jgi:hypothetical protein